MRFALLLLVALASAGADRLPVHTPPPGKVFLLIQPHHDDHTWEYGFGGWVAQLVDAGYTGYYVRVTNDEKDGPPDWAQNDITNQRETVDAVRNLGIRDVISLNWRNDHMDSVPHNEIRAQLVLLIRKYRPDIVMSYHPWGHYDRNPDHRKVAKAVADAVYAAARENYYPEHLALGLRPHAVPHRYYSQRSDYGMGFRPNVAIDLTESQMQRKQRSFWLNRHVRLQPSMTRSVKETLAREGKYIPEIENLSDEDAAIWLQEWRMRWYSARTGKPLGLRYAEAFSHVTGDWTKPENDGAAAAAPLHRKARVVVVTANAADYLLYAGGTLARLIAQGAAVDVLRVTNDEKDAEGLTPEEGALRHRRESDAAARVLGAQSIVHLGYRGGELMGVSPTELRDRILMEVRRLKPDVVFLPNPHAEYDDNFDRLTAGSATEEAVWAAGLRNFQPLTGLAPHVTAELFYYAPPVDPRRREAESTATFAPQPRVVDIRGVIAKKIAALQALPLATRHLGDARVRELGALAAVGTDFALAEEFLYAGPEFGVPESLRRGPGESRR